MRRVLTTLISGCLLGQALADGGEIVALTGRVDYREPTVANWRPAVLRQAVAPASFVRTGDAASVALLLSDRTQVKLGANSMFQVRGVAGAPGTRLFLQRGKAWSQTKNPGGGLNMETPSVTAGIHGTDWVMEVDEAGHTRVTVLSGVVSLENAQGRVLVGSGEEGYAEVGKAPVKRTLVSPRERVQWVGVHRIDPLFYPDLDERRLALLQGEGAALEAELTRRRQAQPDAADWLLGAELALIADRPTDAQKLLDDGAGKYPSDIRFAALAARFDLFLDRPAAARARLDALKPEEAGQLEALLVRGELERLDGRGEAARAAFLRATHEYPGDGRGWLGLAQVEGERDAVAAARRAIAAAEKTETPVDLAAGRLAADQDRLAEARRRFDAALAKDPADYQAWTGLGLVRLKAGDETGALDALLRANVIEPRYAAAVAYSAVVYHRQGKGDTALATLDRASELDRNDPLPHFLRAAVLRDLGRPAEALAAARAAQARLPYLKSLNRLASDRQGSLALGSVLADLGLEPWADAVAQDSALPGWSGSHLFLARQLGAGYSHDNELIQGLLADPTVFGVAGARQPLLSRAGDYLTASMRAVSQHDEEGGEGRLSLQGFRNESAPFAYLLDWRRNANPLSILSGEVDQLTLGLGWRPRDQTGLFLYAGGLDGRLRRRDDDSRIDPLRQSRVDLGWSERLGPHARWWLKLGDGRQSWQSRSNFLISQLNQTHIDDNDLRWRYDDRLGERHGWSVGGEWTSQDTAIWLQQGQGTVDSEREARDKLAWFGWRSDFGALDLEAQLDWHRLDFDLLLHARNPNTAPRITRGAARRDTVGSRFGLVWRHDAAGTWRFAWQDWRKPLGSGGLTPTATAGIALSDATVLPGGRQQRGRLQWEWQSARYFAKAYAERQTVDNLSLDGVAPELNLRPVAGRDTLFGDWDLALPDAETLPAPSQFVSGRIKQGGLAFAALMGQHWSFAADTLYRRSQHRGRFTASASLPNMPRNQTTASLSRLDDAWRLTLQAVYRSEYRSQLQQPVPGRWTANLRAAWRSPQRHWQLTLFGDELGQAGGRFGVGWEYRH